MICLFRLTFVTALVFDWSVFFVFLNNSTAIVTLMFYPVLTASFTYLYRSTQNRGSFEQAHRMRLVLYRFVTQGKGFLGQVWLLLSQNTYWRLSQKKSWETLEFYPPNSRKSFLFRYTTLFLIARGRYYVNFRRTTHFHRSYMKVIRVAFSWWASRIFVVRSTLFQCFLLLSFFKCTRKGSFGEEKKVISRKLQSAFEWRNEERE